MYRIAVQADMFCTLNLHSDMHFRSVVESKAFFSPMLVIIEALEDSTAQKAFKTSQSTVTTDNRPQFCSILHQYVGPMP